MSDVLNSTSVMDFEASQVLKGFLSRRLQDLESIDWVLDLRDKDQTKKKAILEVLNHQKNDLPEPWHTTWALIKFSLENDSSLDYSSTADYLIDEKLKSGNISRALIQSICELVRPRLRVEKYPKYSARPNKIKSFRDIIIVNLVSGQLPPLNESSFADVSDLSLLLELAFELENAVNQGISLGRKIGVTKTDTLWRMGGLRFVGFVDNDDPTVLDIDSISEGIGPAVKLLYATINRIAQINPNDALPFIHRFRISESVIYQRIWALLATNPKMEDSNEVANFLLEIYSKAFWDSNEYPEFSILRASRYSSFSHFYQDGILKRVLSGPSRGFWRKDLSAEESKEAQDYFRLRELERIRLADGHFSKKLNTWIDERREKFPEIYRHKNIYFEFHQIDEPAEQALYRDKLDLLSGQELIVELERLLSIDNVDQFSIHRAQRWIRSKCLDILMHVSELKRCDYKHVLRVLFKSLEPLESQVAPQLLFLVIKLPNSILGFCISELSSLIYNNIDQLKNDKNFWRAWRVLWPIATLAVNNEIDEEPEFNLSLIENTQSSSKNDIDVFNNPVGRLVLCFLRLCPSGSTNNNPFENNIDLKIVRSHIIDSDGKSGLIARHVLLQSIDYFMEVDTNWANEQLIKPLNSLGSDYSQLWSAIAKSTLFREVLETIGDAVLEKSLDRSLRREVRGSLLSRLVLEGLYGYLEDRNPVISRDKIQQAIRLADDEVRFEGARIILRFLKDLPTKYSDKFKSDQVFLIAVKPFIDNVWPKDFSLITKGISSWFAKIPFNSGDKFSEAVSVIEPYLKAFDCWSVSEFGTLGIASTSKLSLIDSNVRACALLKLLDLSIGKAEGSVIPYDLSTALDQIRVVSPKLASTREFKRLSSKARG